MKREEQIREASIAYTKANCPRAIGGDYFRDRVNPFNINHDFIEGAEWADANQPSPWISVEDKLPEMRSDDNPFSERVYVRYVQTVNGKKSIFYEFDELQYVCLSSGKIIGHEWCRHQNKYCRVTHWMPIPKLQEE